MKLYENKYISSISVLLFAVHPVHVEAVAWITGGIYLIVTFFCLMAFYFFILASKKNDNKKFFYIFISLISIILALMSHPVTCFLPFIFILYFYCFNSEIKKISYKLLFLLPYFLIVITSQASLFLLSHNQQDRLDMSKGSGLYHNIMVSINVFNKYCKLIFWPQKLSAVYPFEFEKIYMLILPVIIAGLLLIILFYTSIKDKKLFFPLAWFIIFYIPVSHLLFKISFFTADRYIYIPSIGVFLFFSIIINNIFLTHFKYEKSVKIFVIIILIIITGTFSFLSWERCRVWKDSITLWSDVLKNYPSVSIAYTNRGLGYYYNGDYDKAIRDCTEAIRLDPKDFKAYNNRGISYYKKGEYLKALSDYNKCVNIKPDYIEAYYNRGDVYDKIREYDKAIEDFTFILKMQPVTGEASYKRGLIYAKKGDYQQAINDFTEGLKDNPNNCEIYYNRGIARALKGDYNKAIEDFTEAITINPNYRKAYTNRGNIYYLQRQYDKSIQDYSEALTIKTDAMIYTNSGLAYTAKGDYDKAISNYNEAIKLDPTYIKAYLNRGITYGIKKDYSKVIDDLNIIIKLEPDNKEAYYNRALTYFNMGKYEKAMEDVKKLQTLKYDINSQFLQDLYKALKNKTGHY
ncbi:MAG TPA: tetratricopeptide repeat protein [Candidatus Eremiobacteraeota bacterium]|nr:tetratricopeptide repeat protein [Candidatus Eremiobacteraeota bacterium]